MARPVKKGLLYFPLDVVLDDKFELLEAEFGVKGFGVVIKLMQLIYGGEGYYLQWSERTSLLFSQKNGLSYKFVEAIIQSTLKRKIFDKEKFDKYKILTSKGIQERYLEAAKRRKQIDLKEEYLIIPATQKLINVCNNPINVCNNSINVSNNTTKKRKEKKSKVCEETQHKHTHFFYGRFENVKLTVNEYESICNDYENSLKLIDKVSAILANLPDDRPNHYAYIYRIAENDHWPKRKKQSLFEEENEKKAISPMPEELKSKLDKYKKGL